MKMTWRDSATIILAFAAVFLCGYGIGHLVGERRLQPQRPGQGDSPPAWQQETLLSLQDSLQLRPDQVARVEHELALTAKAIGGSRHDVLLEYHRHILNLYERLIGLLDKEQATILLKEKKLLEKRIGMLSADGP